MSNEIVKTVAKSMEAMQQQLSVTLPSHIPVQKFIRTVNNAIATNPDLIRACTNKEARQSLYIAAQKCAADGLMPDGREAAFVIMGGKIQYMPMAQGLMKAMRNTGEITSISTRVVYANDRFTFVMGDDERIEHEPAPLDVDPGEAIGAYAVIRLKDGDVIREVMRKSEIEKVRNVSRAKNAGTWTTWWSEMARKTVLRRAYKYAPKSADVDQMLARDNDFADLEAQQEAQRSHNAAAILQGVGQPDAAKQATPHDPETGEVLEGEYQEVYEGHAGDDAPQDGPQDEPSDAGFAEREGAAADGEQAADDTPASLAVPVEKDDKGKPLWGKTYVALKASAQALDPADLPAWKQANAEALEAVQTHCASWWPALATIIANLEQQAA